jgi:maltose alpha-D-glucosyltransferase/alpha-amylase
MNDSDTTQAPATAAGLNWGDSPLWYKDAVIYELHVKAFCDSNNDGVGDFRGLTDKLGYLQDLGVNTLWLLPFYPSPMRDDGYDIADYRNIHPTFGTRQDFRQFIREAHRRDLKVITELVINHTSDQHPWFQAARRAPKGSAKRDYYVWSDTAKKYEDTRIIFTDSETSNWSWDSVAGQYYWHRFFSHQPDLNFDNPSVLKAVIRIMRFWLDMGVDGLRLDAIPYLCERDGTSNENIPETHAVIREIRSVIDQHYGDRMLLAEANQWPEDVREYFGNGDECHMAYHFPLMPRLFMAIAREDRHPIVDILRQTPEIPDTCQWAIFLRNHDELTLEMVTDRERDYMYEMYAGDPRARINLGIRRRLAPLMENNRGKIELMTFLLLTLPGTPIIYYGDEIGMGDNIYLGDRNGVRTPMQWGPDRNGGFSRADPQTLYLPPNMDPIYGYNVVNVEAQARNPSSLLNWTKQLIAMRKRIKGAGSGRLTFLEPGNRKIFAYVREHEDEVVLCVVNLSQWPQAVELDLGAWRGRVPVELGGRSVFPPIGELPYLLTLTGYGYYAFQLSTEANAPAWHIEHLLPSELPVLVLTEGWRTFFQHTTMANDVRRAIASRTRGQLTDELLLPYISSKRWFAGKGYAVREIKLTEEGEWSTGEGNWLLTVLTVHFEDAPPQMYFLPLALAWDEAGHDPSVPLGEWTLARVRQRNHTGVLYGAFGDPAFCRALARAMGENRDVPFAGGRLHFASTRAYAASAKSLDEPVRYSEFEQTNTGVFFGSGLYLKGYQRLSPGTNPELEVGRYLTDVAPLEHVPPVLGLVEYIQADGTPVALALLQRFIENQGNAWNYTIEHLNRCLIEKIMRDDPAPQSGEECFYFISMPTLGQRVAELHEAFARSSGDPAFEPEPVTAEDIRQWRDAVVEDLATSLDTLERRRHALPENVNTLADELLALRPALRNWIESVPLPVSGMTKTRYHGDLHLGQILLVGNDFAITDFEGEPARSLTERRRKHSPLRDVAGMLRSFNYAALTVEGYIAAEHPARAEQAAALLREWEATTAEAFMTGYREAVAGLRSIPADAAEMDALITLFTIEKALYELRYEMENRPDWVRVPLIGLLNLAQRQPLIRGHGDASPVTE